jgi:hypothetical protein
MVKITGHFVDLDPQDVDLDPRMLIMTCQGSRSTKLSLRMLILTLNIVDIDLR